jgi:hypothetical protein
VKRAAFLFASASLFAGCGSAVFYEEVPTCAAAVPVAAAPEAIAPPERANEIVVADAWDDSLRDIIHVPPSRATTTADTCVAELAALHAEVTEAIDLAISHRDWRRERCLSRKAQAVGTLYHAAAGYPFRDQEGRAIDLPPFCFVTQIALEAQACAS